MRRQIMTNMTTTISNVFADRSGATSIEYGLLASLIAIASMQALDTVGTALSDTFATAGAGLASSRSGAVAEPPVAAAADEPSVAAARAAPEPPPAGPNGQP